MSHGRPLDRLIEKQRDFVYRQVILTGQAFARIEAASGIVLLLATIVALVWANSPWDESYFDLWHTRILIEAELFTIDLELREWVNDALMTLFFFLMGLEIKRELVHGELSTPRRALLPATAALGGMVAPALIYTAFNLGGGGSHGWGIPMATDIAFALGVLSLLSRRVPFSIRIFLLALAIADDIGAILVIAVFYTSEIDLTALAIAALILATVYVFQRAGVRSVDIYTALGAALWIALLESGVHATIAGVVLGLLTPTARYYNPETFADSAEDMARRYRLADAAGAEAIQGSIIGQMEDLARGTESPLERLERALHHWVSFLIVPVFALANAGVHVTGDVAADALESPISQGVVLGLLIGKPLGIFLFTFAAVRLRLCDMPAGATWPQIFGVGVLGGIGFTVSLLITGLAFEEALPADEARLGVLAGSVVAGLAGFVFLWLTGGKRSEETPLTT